MNEFISKNKQISKNNVLIELMLNENNKKFYKFQERIKIKSVLP